MLFVYETMTSVDNRCLHCNNPECDAYFCEMMWNENQAKPNFKRITEHALFWLTALILLTVYFGTNKPSYWWTLKDNLVYLPIHMTYFYVLAYWIMPRLLFKRKYLLFAFILLSCILSSALITRLIDILIIDPAINAQLLKDEPNYVWDKVQGSFTEQLFSLNYYLNAVKGANLIIWTALTIKFFKMWHERKQAAVEAELNFLKGQIHPHFLFNTLNNLYALTMSQSPKAPSIVMGLSEILRYMLYECRTERIALSREVEIIENYISLEKIRYEERLDLNFNISPNIENCNIAPLLLLPLVENAFKHGTSEQVGEAWINIDLSVKFNTLKFKISNSKPEKLPSDIERHKGRIGLDNVRKRLEILYPSAYDIKIYEEDDMFVLILEIKLNQEKTAKAI